VYLATPLIGDAINVDMTVFFEVGSVFVLGWLALLAGWLATRRSAPGWSIHAHRAACALYVAPLAVCVGLIVAGAALAITLTIGYFKGGGS
jgi:hypothetical protein